MRPGEIVGQSIDGRCKLLLAFPQVARIAAALEEACCRGNRPSQSPDWARAAPARDPGDGCQGGGAVAHIVLEDLIQPAGEQEGIDQPVVIPSRYVHHEAQAPAQLAEIDEQVVGWKRPQAIAPSS